MFKTVSSLFTRICPLLADDIQYGIQDQVVNLTELTFHEVLDLSSTIAHLQEQEEVNLAQFESKIQQSKAQVAGCKALVNRLQELSEELAPNTTLYSTVNPEFSSSFPAEMVPSLLATGNWSQTVERVTVIDMTSLAEVA